MTNQMIGGNNSMNITDVRIRLIPAGNRLRAIASVIFENAFVVHDIKYVVGDSGPYLVMPSRRGGDGTTRDIAHPLNNDMRSNMLQKISEAYEAKIAE